MLSSLRTLALTTTAAALRPSRRQLGSLAATASVVAAVRARKKIGLPSPVAAALAFWAVPALGAGFRRSWLRDGLVWGAQMWAYENAFEMPNDDEQALRRRAHVDYPVAIDSWLGGGVPPAQRLQRRLRRQGQLTWLDKAVTFLYWTWELEPHAVVMWNSLEATGELRGGGRTAGGDLRSHAHRLLGPPPAPPWWVSEELGRLDGDVRRVMAEVASWIKGKPNPTEGDHELGANPFAAMPSDHFASAAMTAILLSEQHPALGAAGWGYALALGLALVYLGEHYLNDELAGLALTLAVNRARAPLTRMAEAVLGLGPGGS